MADPSSLPKLELKELLWDPGLGPGESMLKLYYAHIIQRQLQKTLIDLPTGSAISQRRARLSLESHQQLKQLQILVQIKYACNRILNFFTSNEEWWVIQSNTDMFEVA